MSVEPILVFDDRCSLCRAFVRFVIAHDPGRLFRFTPLAGDAAGEPSMQCGCVSPESVVLRVGRERWHGDEAILRVLSRLPQPWRMLTSFRAIPAPLRRAGYRWVARNRRRMGRILSDVEFSPEEKARFV